MDEKQIASISRQAEDLEIPVSITHHTHKAFMHYDRPVARRNVAQEDAPTLRHCKRCTAPWVSVADLAGALEHLIFS